MHEVDLAVAPELPQDRLTDHLRVRFDHLRLHRAAIHRRRRQRADIAQAQQAHVQRPRDRRGGHRQYVHRLAQLLEPLLLLDAEPLLLVDHHQPQVLEEHVLAEDPVRADQDVDLPLHAARWTISRCSFGWRKRLRHSTTNG